MQIQVLALSRTVNSRLAYSLAIHFWLIASAHSMAEERIVDQEPYDELTLTDASGGTTLKVLPLNLPQRPLVAIPARGSLAVHVIDHPTEDYEIAWTNVARVRVFEQILLNEAQRLGAAADYDAAYDYY